MNTQLIIRDVILEAPLPMVWKALTNTEDMNQWHHSSVERFEATPGFEYQECGGNCKVIEVVPEKKLTTSWHFGNVNGHSLNTYELSTEDNKTRVKITYEGYEIYSDLGSMFSKESFEIGTTYTLNKLSQFINKKNCIVQKSALIDASHSRVWEVLTNLEISKQWASAFQEGNHAVTTWEKDSEVLFKNKDGLTVCKGVVTANTPLKEIRLRFYNPKGDCMSGEFTDELGGYYELFELAEKDGMTVLEVSAGPYGSMYDAFEPKWEEAIKLIKQISENNTVKEEPITKEVKVFAITSEVWKSLTEPERMKEWFFEISKFEPVKGFEFEIFAPGKSGRVFLHNCRVVETIPNKKLSYTWQYANNPGTSLVTFELVDEMCKTILKFSHEGVESFAKGGPDFERNNFVQGWNDFLDVKLKEYLEKPRFNIEKSVLVNASPNRVWEVLTNNELAKNWAKAFGEGCYSVSTWEKGSEVQYKTKEGFTCMKGIVTVNEPLQQLRIEFYDRVQGESMDQYSDKLSGYTQTWSLAEQEGKTVVSSVAGPLGKGFLDFLNSMWDVAMPLVKETAENKDL